MKIYYYDNKSDIYKNIIFFFNRRSLTTKGFLLSTSNEFVNISNSKATYVDMSSSNISMRIKDVKSSLNISVTKPYITQTTAYKLTFYNSINHHIEIHELCSYPGLAGYFSNVF